MSESIERRPMGRTGDRSSILGFGCMRLPLSGDGRDQIDLDLAQAMVRSAIDRGVDYVDTAWPYHSAAGIAEPGASEPFLARALRDGYRERVKLATKLPSWCVGSRADMDRILDAQLRRLDTARIDYYLVHGLGRSAWGNLKNHGLLGFLDEAVKDGRILYPSFSFHDEYPVFEEIVKGYDWAMAMVQYNWLDRRFQAGSAGVDLAHSRGLAVVVMEPLRGGYLVRHLPDGVREILNRARPGWSYAGWAFNWLWSRPGVSVVLSGMSDTAQVDENVALARAYRPGLFTAADGEAVDAALEWLGSRSKAACTACGYCMPCSSGVDIPKNLELLNQYHLFDAEEARQRSRDFYRMLVQEYGKASLCSSCSECVEKCPQGLPVPALLEEAAGIFCTA
ncbi:MAG: aldo/keto reductase [Deltaproteobacteria bacterium]|jgi:predicted aldo/keto reductase-like oxidoreductase|nr:aldo/keto reductase [Deltaproteobacteria bacterium]